VNNSIKLAIFGYLSLLLKSFPLYAHGEDKPGPHGGYIRMPGTFHTEVVPNGKKSIKIYLVDLNFKNPATLSSKIKGWIKQNDKSSDIVCEAKRDFFKCELPVGFSLENGLLEVTANRMGASGVPVQYKLPLSFSK
jgi:hypothetical protein